MYKQRRVVDVVKRRGAFEPRSPFLFPCSKRHCSSLASSSLHFSDVPFASLHAWVLTSAGSVLIFACRIFLPYSLRHHVLRIDACPRVGQMSFRSSVVQLSFVCDSLTLFCSVPFASRKDHCLPCSEKALFNHELPWPVDCTCSSYHQTVVWHIIALCVHIQACLAVVALRSESGELLPIIVLHSFFDCSTVSHAYVIGKPITCISAMCP